MTAQDYLSPKQLAALLGGAVSVKTLANWRSDPEEPGPAYHRLGNRILYPRASVDEWLERRLHKSTRAYAGRRADKGDRQLALKRAALAMRRKALQRELDTLEAELDDLKP
ncbi:helix-turn-helix transcriptional regulator [Phenylobacterium sp.]|uniref:helix-turn-helix transcriptional regulator n=1 Tax=Phenylobacterium sp. TaxID=1871053 RepID=UPI0035B051D3